MNLILHQACICLKFHLSAQLILLEFLKKLSVLIDIVSQLSDLLGGFLEMAELLGAGWTRQHSIGVQSVASFSLSLGQLLITLLGVGDGMEAAGR